jgi:hypothetical protein
MWPQEVKIDMWQHGSGLMWPQEVKIDMWQHLLYPGCDLDNDIVVINL